jgi:hypothetical protein
MRYLPRPGSYTRRHEDKIGDPLDGLINLFDLSLVLAVGFLVAGFSAIGAIDLLAPKAQGTQLQGAPPAQGPTGQGQGKPVGTVYQLEDGRYVFQASPGSGIGGGATSSTGATGRPTTPTGVTGSSPGTSTIPPASGATQPAGGIPGGF